MQRRLFAVSRGRNLRSSGLHLSYLVLDRYVVALTVHVLLVRSSRWSLKPRRRNVDCAACEI